MFPARPVHGFNERSDFIWDSHTPLFFTCYELMGQSQLNATRKLAVKVAALVTVLLVRDSPISAMNCPDLPAPHKH
jgi:hypothetical protein